MGLWQKLSGKGSSAISEEAVSQAIGGVLDLSSLQGIHINGDKVYFTLTTGGKTPQELEPLRAAAVQAVEKIAGVSQAVGVLTNDKNATEAAGEAGEGKESASGIGEVKHIIAVASGKGGVGKSTIAANLALALQAVGMRAGLMDADIYGPSQPLMMGVSGKPQSDGKVMKPHMAHGIPVASIGFMVDAETPMIWRGPMVQSALMQLLEKVEWGTLDVLVIDMPPGTGDAQLTLSQQVPLAGAVIVSTPQDIALLDAVKAIKMFEKVNVPILGLVENMSYFACPKCGERSEIFSHGGAEAEAKKRGFTFLGALPLATDIRSGSDSGQPIMTADDNDKSQIFLDIAGKISEALKLSPNNDAPEIIFS